MTKNRKTSRKTNKIVRTPASRFAHLQKKGQKVANRPSPKTKHS